MIVEICPETEQYFVCPGNMLKIVDQLEKINAHMSPYPTENAHSMCASMRRPMVTITRDGGVVYMHMDHGC